MAEAKHKNSYRFNIEQQWSVLSGMAYGIKQPTMFCVLSTNIEHNKRFEKLEKYITNAIGGDKDISPSKDPVHYLITRILQWQSIVQQQHKVPVFDCFYIKKLASKNKECPRYLIALPYSDPRMTRDLVNWFVQVLLRFNINSKKLLTCSPTEFKANFITYEKQLNQLRMRLSKLQLSGMNTYAFIEAAHKLGIPTSLEALNVFRFGSGQYSKLLDSSFTENTGVIAATLARSKMNTAKVLRRAGLPAPTNTYIRSEEDISRFCEQFKYPVVIKPDDLDQGQGVFAGLFNKKQVAKSFNAASKLSKNILIERHVLGDDYRLTVLNGEVIKVIRRTCGGITGDGSHTISQLIAIEQQTGYLQSVFKQTGKMALALDSEAIDLLKDQNITPQSTPKNGQFIPLRRKSNMSTGGTVSLIPLNSVHPDNLSLAVRSAQVINLDLAGIDLIISDISQSWLNTEAIICEVNAQPQIGYTVTPNIYQDILTKLLQGHTGIPLHLVICPEPLEDDLPEQLIQKYGCNTVAKVSGLWVDGIKITRNFPNSFSALKAVAHQKTASSALCYLSYTDAFKLGLPFSSFHSIDLFTQNIKSPEHTELIEKINKHTNNLNIHQL